MVKEKNQLKPEGILQNIITYFCFRSRILPMTKLVKLVYIADVYNYQLYGKRLTEVPFKRYHYGVWSSDIGESLEELHAKGILYEEMVETIKGDIAIIPKPKISETVINLSKDAIEILETVVEEWGNASSAEVVEFTKNSLPFLDVSFNEEIDFSRTDGIKEYAKKKKISEEEAATLDIISDENFKKDVLKGIKDMREGKFLSHQEVFGE